MNRSLKNLLGVGIVAASLATATLGVPTSTADAQAMMATLKQSIIIDRPVITLSDLLDGAETAEEVVVAHAPAPGDRLALNPIAIARIAASRGIRWMPPAGMHRITVTRASAIVPMADIMAEIELALSDRTNGKDMEIEVAGNRSTLHVATDQLPTVEVISMDFAPRTGRFSVIVSAPAGDPSARRERLHGRAWAMADIPVLSRTVRPGDEITEADVAWQRVRETRVRRQTVVDAAELIGMSPKRHISANRSIRISDLQSPIMIPKGSNVTMVYRHGGLLLKASGRAMENGGRNDVIRVMNDRSRLTIEARVTAPGQVNVLPAGTRVSQLTR
ncbi:MAG: flagellar basal body P-ring formation chaperone FlgA [Minwuia sp.]|nr:flagellar basal body P-ring formation chaperone FlgA [Minwuia sp.]